MDVDTASAIDRLGERIDALDTSLRGVIDGRFSALDTSLRGVIDDRISALDASLRGVIDDRISALDTSFRGVIDDRISALDSSLRTFVRRVEGSLRVEIADLRVELREGLAESRRHATILNESTREDIRFVAEAVAGLTVKIDSLLQ